MDAVIKVLTDPASWVNGVFFGMVVWLMQLAIPKIPFVIRGITRRRRLTRTKRIRVERVDQFAVQRAISKANADYVVFMLLASLFFYGLLFSQMRVVVGKSLLLGVILAIPVFIFELLWLIRDQYSKDLIKSRAKLIKEWRV